MGKLVVELDGLVFGGRLFDRDAFKTCEALKSLGFVKGKVFHAMWSGELILVKVPELASLPVENRTTYLRTGSIILHPGHLELGIAYSETQFKEPTGPVYVTKLGEIVTDLEMLGEVGLRIHREGMKEISLRWSRE